jgi:predicted nucleic acid-binding protein
MRHLTVDASVIIAKTMNESRPMWIDEVLTEAALGSVELIAPAFLWIEIGNRLSRHDMSDELALEGMLRIDSFRIRPVDLDRPLWLRCLHLAREHGLTMYDATYLAVAEAHASPLLTLDRRLEQAARDMGLGPEGDERVSEPAAPYGDRPVDRTSIAAIGAALAEMRKEYSL